MPRRKNRRTQSPVSNTSSDVDYSTRRYNSTRFAESLSDPKGNLKIAQSAISSITADTVSKYLDSPETNLENIASLMETLRRKNGIVGRQIDYFKSHPTFNHTIYGTMNKRSKYDIEKLSEYQYEYFEAANYIDQYNIRFFTPYFIQETLVGGTSYFYKIQDSKGIAYMQFPVAWGRIYTMLEGVYRWELDISKIKEEIVPYMPVEVQQAYKSYKTNSVKDWREGKWYKVSEKGVAFCFNPNVLKEGGVAISEFASLLVDSFQLEKAKENVDIKDDIDTIRLIHNKIPIGKDGVPTMSGEAARIYDANLRRALPKGVASITNPMEVENVNLTGTGNAKSYSTVLDAQSQLFTATGTPSNLFGATTTSSKIVELSLRKDSAWVFSSVIPPIENYYNYEMSKFKAKSKLIWKFKFLRQSVYTAKEDSSTMKDAISVGGSRLDYLASLGYDPIEAMNKLIMEQKLLEIDNFMLPKQTSYTMSSKDNMNNNNDVQPNKEVTEDTERIIETE